MIIKNMEKKEQKMSILARILGLFSIPSLIININEELQKKYVISVTTTVSTK
jgi:hypothetical protein